MKIFNCCLFALLFLINSFFYISPQKKKSLAEIYKNGSVRFIPILSINEKSMPKDTFLENVIKIDVDEMGYIYVCDYGANNIKKFDPNGKYTKTIGRKGQGPGELSRPFDIAVTNDRLIVYDMGNRRICAFTSEGKFIKLAAVLMDEGRPEKMRVLPNGNIVIGLEKTYFRELDRPQDYIINVYSADLVKTKTVFTQQIWHYRYKEIEGIFSNIIQPFSPLVYWDVTPDGKIVIGDSDNYEIHIYDNIGSKLHVFSKPFERVKVTAKDKEIFFKNMAYSSGGFIKRGVPDHVKKITDIPKFKPAFKQILVDSEGNILVCVHRESRKEELRYFDAFSPHGDFLGSVQIIGGVSFPFRVNIKNRSFWLIETDEEGLIKIVKYRICD